MTSQTVFSTIITFPVRHMGVIHTILTSSPYGSYPYHFGGAIFSDGILGISGSTFTGNYVNCSAQYARRCVGEGPLLTLTTARLITARSRAITSLGITPQQASQFRSNRIESIKLIHKQSRIRLLLPSTARLSPPILWPRHRRVASLAVKVTVELSTPRLARSRSLQTSAPSIRTPPAENSAPIFTAMHQ